MWHLMSQSVDTCLLIAYWEFLMSLDACSDIVFVWDIDMLIMMIDLSWLRILRYLFFLCFIVIFVWDINILIVSINHLVLLSIVIMIFAMIVLIALHLWIHFCISFDLTCQFSSLYIILIIFEHDICITIHPDRYSLYVYMSDIFCTLLDYMLHDYLSSAWLYVICPCGPHIYPFISNPLVLVISFISILTFASVRSCVCLFSNQTEVRSKVWRQAIPMFGSIMEESNTLMPIEVWSLKTCVAPS